uniref:Uncharacterized protein n=1 Tax=Athene cunicularia TaxID=194338 RepID=A0A663MKB7_ATHCN
MRWISSKRKTLPENIISCFFFFFFFFFFNDTGFTKPLRPFMRCGYRGTFCFPGTCPHGNTYLGSCRLGHSCCKW